MKKIISLCTIVLMMICYIGCDKHVMQKTDVLSDNSESDTVVTVLETMNVTLKDGLSETIWKKLTPIITTIFSVVAGAFLGCWLTNRSEKKREIRDNHKRFLEDFNSYYIQWHNLYQEINSYNRLIQGVGFPQYIYNINLSHNKNIPNIQNAELEYKKYIQQNPNGTDQCDKYWNQINDICDKLLDFNLVIKFAGSMDQKAVVSSMFVKKHIKKAFDRMLKHTQILSQNDCKQFCLVSYLLELIGILQLIKNEIDPDHEPIYFEFQDNIFVEKDAVKLNVYYNCFYVQKKKKDKIICKNAKGKKFCFDVQETEPF